MAPSGISNRHSGRRHGRHSARLSALELSEPCTKLRGRMRNAARAALIAIGALYAWHWRFYVNPDGVAYFDVADALFRRGWFAAVNDHRSPLFPLLIGIATRLFHVPPYYESTAAHGVAFLMYCGALLALERLLAALRNDALVPLAYLLFLWGCNFAMETGPAT